MTKLEFFNIPASKINKDTKGQILKQTVMNIAHALTGKKEKTQEIADAKNPFGIKKAQLEGASYSPSDIVKIFESITKEQLENYKKICRIDNVDLKTLKTKGVIFNRLIDFQESLPIFVETHDNGSYRLEHNTQTPGPNETRIKWFDITQTKDGQKKEIQKNAEVSFKILFDNIPCLEIKPHGRGDPILIPIKSISQEKKVPVENKVEPTENKMLSAMEQRLAASKNKKAAERAKMYIKLFSSTPNTQIAEMDLMDRQGDLLDLIEGNADEGIKKRYENWEEKDFLDLYTILYGEKIGFN